MCAFNFSPRARQRGFSAWLRAAQSKMLPGLRGACMCVQLFTLLSQTGAIFKRSTAPLKAQASCHLLFCAARAPSRARRRRAAAAATAWLPPVRDIQREQGKKDERIKMHLPALESKLGRKAPPPPAPTHAAGVAPLAFLSSHAALHRTTKQLPTKIYPRHTRGSATQVACQRRRRRNVALEWPRMLPCAPRVEWEGARCAALAQ